jgi:hypothetical protein
MDSSRLEQYKNHNKCHSFCVRPQGKLGTQPVKRIRLKRAPILQANV